MNNADKNGALPPFPVVETIRAEIRKMDFTPLNDDELADMRERLADAVQNNAIEDLDQNPVEVALDSMLLEERAPLEIQKYATRRYLEIDVMDGESLEQLFEDH